MFVYNLLYSWNLSLKYFFHAALTRRVYTALYSLNHRFSFLTGFPQLFIKQFGFTFSQYYQCFRHPGVKRSIFIGRIYIFFREWTFETVIIKTILAQKHNYLKCTCIASASIVSYGVCALKTENIFAMCDIFMKDCFQSPWI